MALDKEQKRFIFLCAVLILVCALITTLFFVLQPKKHSNIVPTVKITDVDKSEIEKISKDFISKDGSWGFDSSTITPTNLMDIKYAISSNSGLVDSYWLSRQKAYEKVLPLLTNDSPLKYDNSVTSNWTDQKARMNLMNFKVTDVSLSVPNEASLVSNSSGSIKTVLVDTSFNSVETMYYKTGTSADWDGTFAILSKNFPHKTQIVAQYDSNSKKWMLKDMYKDVNDFSLVTCRNPDVAYGNSQNNFTKIDTFKIDMGKK